MTDPLARQRQMVAQHPQNELARYSLGRALFDRGEFKEAREHLRLAVAKKSDWMAVEILLGKCELELGDRPAALAAFGRARDLAIAQHHEGPLAEMEQLLSELS
ncbi:MAG TPA: tetratricopeptide repeat protein [Candidatus Limnocylindria bacterium]|jgi:Flp pilus assembly protein TadD|nr:tetratricopeptide repeat protein [Candidatus Limnocylindria bacterium]